MPSPSEIFNALRQLRSRGKLGDQYTPQNIADELGVSGQAEMAEIERVLPTIRGIGLYASARDFNYPTRIILHIFQLSDTIKFERSEMSELCWGSALSLDRDVLAHAKLELAPPDRAPASPGTISFYGVGYSGDLDPGARFIGAIALFRNIDQAPRRAIAPVIPTGTTQLTLKVTRHSIYLEKRVFQPIPLPGAVSRGRKQDGPR